MSIEVTPEPTAPEQRMPTKRRITQRSFKLSPWMSFDDAKRNLKQLVMELSERGGDVTLGKSPDRPSFLIYAYDEAGERGDNLREAHRTTVAEFVKKPTSWQTILRYEGSCLVLEAGGVPRAVIKSHPSWKSAPVEYARDRLLQRRPGDLLREISAKLDQVLKLLKRAN